VSERARLAECSSSGTEMTLASVISVPELLHSANLARSLTYNSSPLILAAIIYLLLLLPVVRLIARLEHRL